MTQIFVFDVVAFRLAFPTFANETDFPDATLQAYWDTAICYVSDVNYGRLSDESRLRALNLMTAHLTAISVIIAKGQTPGLMQSATIDKINVVLTPPPLKSQWQWWLSLTAYGQQFFALLQVKSCGGFFIGGSLDRAAFFRRPTF